MEQTLPNQSTRVPRISVDCPVILIAGEERFLCRARKLSECGIFLNATQRELIGENVQIDLFLEHPKTFLSLPGIVVSAVDSGIGISFTDMPPEQQSTLIRYVEARSIGVMKS